MINTKPLLILLAFVSCTHLLLAQITPQIEWRKNYGGSQSEVANWIQQTFDGGYIVCGSSNSYDGDITDAHGTNNYKDCWVLKLDSIGTIEWKRSYGGSDEDACTAIIQTKDSGFVFTGSSTSTDGDLTGIPNFGSNWIVKLDKLGNIKWQKRTYGGLMYSTGNIIQTTDGGYIQAGTDGDYVIEKLDSLGDVQWRKFIGGWAYDAATNISQTFDSGYIVAGYSYSDDKDVTGHHGTGDHCDFWIVKLNNNGIIEWQKSLGGSQHDGFSGRTTVHQTPDTGYIVAGSSLSNDGDVTGHHGTGPNDDYWIVKLNSAGNIEWQKSFGGSNNDQAYAIQPTVDGGYVIAGNTSSTDGDVNKGGVSNIIDYDSWIVKLSAAGKMDWMRIAGGTQFDEAIFIQQTKDSNYIIAGSSASDIDDIITNHGSNDYWVYKLTVQTYTFTGSGNWDDAANWFGNSIPPSDLNAGNQIIINTLPGGVCNLNVPLQIHTGAALKVSANSNFIIGGNLTILREE